MRCAAAELGPDMQREGEEEGVVWCGSGGGCARKKMLEATKFQRRKADGNADAGLEATTGTDRRSASWNSHFGEGEPGGLRW